jgi:hypothetical protein
MYSHTLLPFIKYKYVTVQMYFCMYFCIWNNRVDPNPAQPVSSERLDRLVGNLDSFGEHDMAEANDNVGG